jgi:ribonuclease Y
MDLTMIIAVVLGIVGVAVGFFIGKKSVSADVEKLEEESKKEALRIVENAKKEADTIHKNKLIEAKEEILKQTADFDSSTRERESKLVQKENDLKNR